MLAAGNSAGNRAGAPAFAALFVIVMGPSGLAAQGDDGVYGRLSGDVIVEVGAGGGVTFNDPVQPNISGAGALELRARYLDAAGIALAGQARPEGQSRISIMADIRPLWLPRFLLGASFHDRRWDVFLDSFGVDLGVAIVPLDETVGIAFTVGFGFDIPLVFFSPGIDGISLRLFGRHVASLATDRFGPDASTNDWIAGALLVIRGQVSTGLTAWEPPRYRTRPAP